MPKKLIRKGYAGLSIPGIGEYGPILYKNPYNWELSLLFLTSKPESTDPFLAMVQLYLLSRLDRFNEVMRSTVKPLKPEFDITKYGLPDYAQLFKDEHAPMTEEMKKKTAKLFAHSGDPKLEAFGSLLLSDILHDINIDKIIKSGGSFVGENNGKPSFGDKFNNSFFGKHSNLINASLDLTTDVGNMISGGPTSKTEANISSVFSAGSDLAEYIPVAGDFVKMLLKGVRAANSIQGAIFGKTAGKTGIDRILNSELGTLAFPLGAINLAFGRKTDTITKDTEAFNTVGASYTGTENKVDEAVENSGIKFGTFSSGALNEENAKIAKAKGFQGDVALIAQNTEDLLDRRHYMSDMNGYRRALNLQGRWDLSSIHAARHGLSLKTVMAAKRAVSRLKYGGSSKKKTRTIEELIEYAKEQNPRFIQRLSEPPRGILFIDDKGNLTRGNVYLEWGEDDKGNAIIYPRILEMEDGKLKFLSSDEAWDRAVANKNVLIMSPDEARLFFSEDPEFGTAYKRGWPEMFKGNWDNDDSIIENLTENKEQQHGGKKSKEVNNPFDTFVQSLPKNLLEFSNYRMRDYWEFHGRPKNFKEAVDKGMFTLEADGFYHAKSVAENPQTGDIEYMKASNHPTRYMESDWYEKGLIYNSDGSTTLLKEGMEGYDDWQLFVKDYELQKTEPYWKYVRRPQKNVPSNEEQPSYELTIDLYKEGGVLNEVPSILLFFVGEIYDDDEDLPEYGEGGKVNVIPEGALHARLHHMENDENITKKGIPVVSEDENGKIEQQAEIERAEVIFRLEVTKKLEELAKEGTDKAAIEAGKLLVEELLNNTIDNTNSLL